MCTIYQHLVESVHRRTYRWVSRPCHHSFICCSACKITPVSNVDQLTHEDDKWYGIFGDHVIRGKVQPVKDNFREVLGPNACKIIEDNYQWFFNDLGYKL